MKASPYKPSPNETAPTPDPTLRVGYNTHVAETLRPVALALGLLYAILAAVRLLALPPGVATITAGVAGGMALAMLGLFLALGRRQPPLRWAHPLAAAMAGLVLLNSLLLVYLTGEPRQTTSLILLVVGAGFFFLSWRWLALVVAATLVGWGWVAALSPPSPD